MRARQVHIGIWLHKQQKQLSLSDDAFAGYLNVLRHTLVGIRQGIIRPSETLLSEWAEKIPEEKEYLDDLASSLMACMPSRLAVEPLAYPREIELVQKLTHLSNEVFVVGDIDAPGDPVPLPIDEVLKEITRGTMRDANCEEASVQTWACEDYRLPLKWLNGFACQPVAIIAFRRSDNDDIGQSNSRAELVKCAAYHALRMGYSVVRNSAFVINKSKRRREWSLLIFDEKIVEIREWHRKWNRGESK